MKIKLGPGSRPVNTITQSPGNPPYSLSTPPGTGRIQGSVERDIRVLIQAHYRLKHRAQRRQHGETILESKASDQKLVGVSPLQGVSPWRYATLRTPPDLLGKSWFGAGETLGEQSDQVSQMQVESPAGGGIPADLAQLGVKAPRL